MPPLRLPTSATALVWALLIRELEITALEFVSVIAELLGLVCSTRASLSETALSLARMNRAVAPLIFRSPPRTWKDCPSLREPGVTVID